MIESIFGAIFSGFLGLIFLDIRDMKTQINKIENELIIMNFIVPKRKTDIDRLPEKLDNLES